MKENESKGVIPEEELPVAVAEDLPVADKEALDKPDTHGPIVHMRGITKRFGNFTANHDIDFQVEKQEIHALLGENGAGKTTLMNILYGLYEPTEGDVYIRGEKCSLPVRPMRSKPVSAWCISILCWWRILQCWKILCLAGNAQNP